MTTAIPKIRPRERRGDRTRARLVEAALAEFRRHGFERASIAGIAEAAGVSRPSFYFHFATKEDLLREVLLALEVTLVERVERTEGLRAALLELVEGILELQQEVGPEVFAEMLRAQTRAHPPAENPPQPVGLVVEARFREGAANGELRPELDPARAPRLYLASLFGCLLDVEDAGAPEHADGLRILTSLFLTGPPNDPRAPRDNPVEKPS